MYSALYKSICAFLVLVMVLLPLRPVLAMAVVDTINISHGDEMSVSMTPHCHDAQQADALLLIPEHQVIVADALDEAGCQCCSGCDSDCSGCTSMQAITFESLLLSESSTIALISVSIPLLLTRTIAPPGRPPLAFNI